MPIYNGKNVDSGLPVSIKEDVRPISATQVVGADETVANTVSLDTLGLHKISAFMSATTATTFYVDISEDNSNWGNWYTSASAETKHIEDDLPGFRYVRLRHDTAGTSGTDTVTLAISGR